MVDFLGWKLPRCLHHHLDSIVTTTTSSSTAAMRSRRDHIVVKCPASYYIAHHFWKYVEIARVTSRVKDMDLALLPS
jgi:hypothetical protein